jgi:ketosteroid isomerase-like protein
MGIGRGRNLTWPASKEAMERVAASTRRIEVVRRAIDAFNDRDLDAAMREVGPEVEVDWSRSRGVEAGIYRGYDACRSFWSTFIDTFDRVTIAADEFIDSGGHVVVPNRACAQGRDGIEVAARSVAVVTLRDGRIAGWRLYQEKAEALEAAGKRD